MQISIKLTLILSFSTCLNLCGMPKRYLPVDIEEDRTYQKYQIFKERFIKSGIKYISVFDNNAETDGTLDTTLKKLFKLGIKEEFIKDTFLHTYASVELNKCVESYFKKTISENTFKKLFNKFYDFSMTEEDRKLRRIWACNSMLQGTKDTLELFKRFINIGKHLNEGFLLQDGYHKMYHKSIFGLIKYIYSPVRKKKYENILKLAQKVLEFNKVLVSKS